MKLNLYRYQINEMMDKMMVLFLCPCMEMREPYSLSIRIYLKSVPVYFSPFI